MNHGLAVLMAATHGSFIAFLVSGALLARRWPRLVRPHLGAVAATAAVFLTGQDCPLTTWENHFRAADGRPVIEGFVEHYVVLPIHDQGMTPAIQAAVLAAWIVPSVVGYRRLWRTRSAVPARGTPAPDKRLVADQLVICTHADCHRPRRADRRPEGVA
jgi:hypothetical protein